MDSMFGQAMQEFSDMLKKPAHVPEETPILITELLMKMQRLEDISGHPVDDVHAKSILVGILDPVTKQLTAREHHKKFEELKKIVLETANGCVSNVSATTKVSSLEGKEDNDRDRPA